MSHKLNTPDELNLQHEEDLDIKQYLPELVYKGHGDISENEILRRKREEDLRKKYGITLFDEAEYF